MKTLLVITLLWVSLVVEAQQTFYDVYNTIISLRQNYEARYRLTGTSGNIDSLLLPGQDSPESKQLFGDIDNLAHKIAGLSFPDITFTDARETPYILSDFSEELILNYNYPYCMTCINRIDSTQKRTDKKNIKILVLFPEAYKKDISFLKPFNENVSIGFVSNDTRDLIALTLNGKDCMYYLNANHRIEFFDNWDDEKWIRFLDTKLK